jgi:ribosomal protein S18 acetylase RimI-like enzyme
MYKNIEQIHKFGDYKIRQVSSLDEIFKILCEFDNIFEPSLSKTILELDRYAQKLYKNAIVFIITDNKECIGFIAFYANDKNNNQSYIAQLAVKDKSQNKNIGKLLLEICIKFSEENNMKSIKLEVWNQNKIAIEFYKKNGFREYMEASSKSMYMIKIL